MKSSISINQSKAQYMTTTSFFRSPRVSPLPKAHCRRVGRVGYDSLAPKGRVGDLYIARLGRSLPQLLNFFDVYRKQVILVSTLLFSFCCRWTCYRMLLTFTLAHAHYRNGQKIGNSDTQNCSDIVSECQNLFKKPAQTVTPASSLLPAAWFCV